MVACLEVFLLLMEESVGCDSVSGRFGKVKCTLSGIV